MHPAPATGRESPADAVEGAASGNRTADPPPGPVLQRFDLRVEDMDCASCLDTIRRRLRRIAGVADVEGSPVGRRITVDYDPSLVRPEDIRREVSDLGYRALFPEATARLPTRTWSGRRALRTYASGGLFFAGLTLRLILHGTIVDAHGGPAWPSGEDLLFGAAAAIGAWNFVPRAMGALRARVLDMHVLMALAVVGAVAIGEYMEAAAIAFLFSVAELLETFAAERAEASVRSLMEKSTTYSTGRRASSRQRARSSGSWECMSTSQSKSRWRNLHARMKSSWRRYSTIRRCWSLCETPKASSC